MIRWYLDLAIDGVRLVGKVWQTPPVGESPKGGVRPPSPWVAVGMAAAWGDTDLGQNHPTRAAAMQAVVDWWAGHSKTLPAAVPLPGSGSATPKSVEGGK